MRGVFRTIGELLFTAGLVMLLFAAFQIWGKQFQTDAEQDRLDQAMAEQWEEPDIGPDGEPLPGSANSRLYIPETDQNWVVVSGKEPEDIRYGPGWYPESWTPEGMVPAARAGEAGNYSIAGHRVAAVFWDLDQLEEGDEVVLEDKDNFYTYAVVESTIVLPDAIEVTAPDPFDPESTEEPDKAFLTLTTCHPKLQNSHRLIIHAELTDTRPKDQGMPENIAHMAPDAETEG
ncbi:sortase A [Actinorugispora endophytica]|uniref:Sortase A n=1 Tax=Actinorugispora endophytica TaxID=1605990 RepID=A0A4R6UD27_9ACTN|nr:class E sortase [Actinorugispora endophytica]TDQ44588.1 sortase A [Actinorugispora endophytica]